MSPQVVPADFVLAGADTHECSLVPHDSLRVRGVTVLVRSALLLPRRRQRRTLPDREGILFDRDLDFPQAVTLSPQPKARKCRSLG